MALFSPIHTALTLIGIPILVYFSYTLLTALLGFKRYEKFEPTAPKNRFAAVIAARNEEEVIGQLVDSLKATKYPTDLLDIWVIPNNCEDNTAGVAKEHGANVYIPRTCIRSKGDALKEFFGYILNEYDHYDAFCIFDADNLVTPNFFHSMNDALEAGEVVAQGYRESKNPKDSWISGSQSMFYWITNRFLNCSKRHFGMSAVINGTGFMISRHIIKEIGFDTHTMTEDIEFSTQCIIQGYKIAFVADAVTYDEHPVDFDTSWKQRKRWSTGIIQTFYSYTPKLFKCFCKTHKWLYIDMILYLIAPYFQVLGALYSIATLSIYGIISVYAGYTDASFAFAVLINSCGLVVMPLTTLLIAKMEGHKLSDCCSSAYISFWWFITSWIFINVEVFFKPITTWEPIKHQRALTLSELKTVPAQES